MRLRIALQKSGRLAERSRELVERAGLVLAGAREGLTARAENLAVDVLFVRDEDVPELVREGAADLGICGRNVFAEQSLGWPEGAGGVVENLALRFGACRLAIATPASCPWDGPTSLAGRRIATSYPRLLARYLGERDLEATIVEVPGAVELSPRLGRAEAICDLVSTGETLAAHGLVERDLVFASAAVVLGRERPAPGDPDDRGALAALEARLLERIAAVERVRDSRYVMLHAPKSALGEIARLLPGSESPTVIPLHGLDDRVAVHALCSESVVWETLESLRAAGASSVLVLPVEKMLA